MQRETPYLQERFWPALQFLFYIVHYVEGIRIRRLAQTDNDGGRIIKMGHHIITVRSQFNPGNIFEADYSPVGIGGNHNILKSSTLFSNPLAVKDKTTPALWGLGAAPISPMEA